MLYILHNNKKITIIVKYFGVYVCMYTCVSWIQHGSICTHFVLGTWGSIHRDGSKFRVKSSAGINNNNNNNNLEILITKNYFLVNLEP